MSRERSITPWRPAVVWTAVTAGVLAAARGLPGAWHAVGTGAAHDRVEDLLVAACTTGLVAALGWLWVITTLTVAGLLGGSGWTSERSGATRRLVLLACGVAVVAGTSVPAGATGGDGPDLLVGLTLPERAVAPPHAHRARQSQPRSHDRPQPAQDATTYVVRPGDSLWSIARDHPGGEPVDQRWRAIWLANHDVVGDDPDLILPGQALRLPAIHDPSSDGDR